MADDKRETRKAILRELESIKDLLLDHEDIPILNDAIDMPPIVSAAFDNESDLSSPDSSRQRAPGKDPPPAGTREQATPPRQTPLAAEGIGTNAETTTKQQSLFSESDEAVAHLKTSPPEIRQTCAKPGQEKADSTAKPAEAAAIPRENPFLPKHIRDRLHTHRSLVDEIKNLPMESRRGPRGKDAAFVDSPSFAAVTTHLPTTTNNPDTIVDELIAEFMPKIEAELRRRLEAIIQAPGQKPEDTNKR